MREYKRLYPDVEVTYEIIAGTEYSPYGNYAGRVAAEMMAGNGPDVIYIAPNIFPDIYKTMDTGAFFDLDGILEKDSDINLEDYYKPVIDGGIHKGARYLLPVSFKLPGVIVANKAEASRAGLDLSKITDAEHFLTEAAKAAKNERDNPVFRQLSSSPMSQNVTSLMTSYGIRLFDYDNKTALPDEENIRKFFEALKAYFTDSGEAADNLTFLTAPDCYYDGSALLFPQDSLNGFWYTAAALKADGRGGYAAFALKAPGGGLRAEFYDAAAVRAASANTQNAYNFIKVLLSDAVQIEPPGIGYLGGANGVKKSSVKNALDAMTGKAADARFGEFTAEDARIYSNFLDEITDCSFILYGTSAYEKFNNKMYPYLYDKNAKLDECIKGAKKELSLYLSE